MEKECYRVIDSLIICLNYLLREKNITAQEVDYIIVGMFEYYSLTRFFTNYFAISKDGKNEETFYGIKIKRDFRKKSHIGLVYKSKKRIPYFNLFVQAFPETRF